MKRIASALSLALLAGLAPAAADAALVRGNLGTAHGRATRVATRALARNAQRLGVDASAFRFTTVTRSNVGTHVRGFEFADGVRVEGSAAIVSIVARRVVWVEAEQARGRPARRRPPSSAPARRARPRSGSSGSARRSRSARSAC